MIALVHGAPAFGAVERYVVAIARGVRASGEDVLLVVPDAPELAPLHELENEGVRIETFPVADLAGPAPLLALRLVRVLRRERPWLVHVNDVWPTALVAARLADVRRLIVTHHTPELPRSDNVFGRVWMRLGWLARPEVIFTSDTDRARSRTRLHTHVVPLGIDLGRFAHAQPALARDGRIVGNVARLAPQKGHRVLIDAAPLVLEGHPDVRFVVVGDGELRGELARLASEAGLADRFEFTGARDDVPEMLASFDVFAFPSLFEGLCLAVIEAQAAGVPVVATGVGGLAETVVPGETGVRCETGDARSLAEGISWVLDHPVDAAALAGEASRRAQRYSVERMVAETLALY